MIFKRKTTMCGLLVALCTGLGTINAITTHSLQAETSKEPYSITYNQTDLSHCFDQNYVDDKGKSGLNLKAKKSGETAEGISFSFDHTFQEAFTLDFRVSSERDYDYPSTGWGTTHYIGDESQGLSPSNMFSDDMNPYLDLKEITFTFTPINAPDMYFNVCVRGATGYMASMCSAYVYVAGDETNAMKNEKGEWVQGFGYSHKWTEQNGQWIQGQAHYDANGNGDVRSDYSMSNDGITAILGTSFSNFLTTSANDKTEAKTISNLIRFDPTTMNVYVNSGKSTGSMYGTTNEYADTLIRDISKNAYFKANNNGTAATIPPEIFKDGYNVSVSFTDITADSCKGNATLFNNPSLYRSISKTYDRFASVTLYSLNGTPFNKTNVHVNEADKTVNRSLTDFISYDDTTVQITENVGSRAYTEKGLNIKALKSGTAAENISFRFKDVMFGSFSTSFRVTSEKDYTPNADRSRQVPSTHWLQSDPTTAGGFYHDLGNPYVDLREIAFTFISKSNPEKLFTCYIIGVSSGKMYATTARVYAVGDEMGQLDEDKVMRYGYALSNEGRYSSIHNLPRLSGTSFCNLNLSNKNENIATYANTLRFDPKTMCVYSTSTENGVTANVLLRNLSTNEGYIGNGKVSSLSPSDFLKGYEVKVTFTDVTDDSTIGGLTKNGEHGFNGVENKGAAINDGYKPIESSYERYPELVLYEINGQLLSYHENTGKLMDTTAPVVEIAASQAILGENLDCTPLYYDAASGSNVPLGDTSVSISTNGIDYTELSAIGNSYEYCPENYGFVYVKYMGFADSANNPVHCVYKLPVVDTIPPELAFGKNVAMQYDFSKSDLRPTISLDDVVVTNALPGIKTYVTRLVSITRANGTSVSTNVTNLNYFEKGEYKIVYEVEDNFGNTSTITRTILAGDFSAPEISNVHNMSGLLGEQFELQHVSVIDYDKETTLEIAVYENGEKIFTGNTFTPHKSGMYTVVYTAIDSSGNSSEMTCELLVSALPNDYYIQYEANSYVVPVILFSLTGIGIIAGIVIICVRRKKNNDN